MGTDKRPISITPGNYLHPYNNYSTYKISEVNQRKRYTNTGGKKQVNKWTTNIKKIITQPPQNNATFKPLLRHRRAFLLEISGVGGGGK